MTNYNERLDEVLERLYRIAADTELAADRCDPYAFNGVSEAKQELEALIRTEKLKLLAEVRERVIGEDVELNSFEIPMYEEEFVITSVTQQNNLRADQRISLAKLEANQ